MTILQEFYLELDNIEKQSSTGLISIKDVKRSIGYFYLEKEKQQIIDAYETGDKYKFEIPGEQYYKNTYENK